MESKYIDKYRLHNAIQARKSQYRSERDWNDLDTRSLPRELDVFDIVTEIVEKFATVDLQAVQEYQWEVLLLHDGKRLVTCPVCHYADVYTNWLPKFCPNCGAKMEGKTNDNN